MIQLDIENVSGSAAPSSGLFQSWADAAAPQGDTELSIRIVDEAESAELNLAYRNKHGPTNVLSFPCETPEGVPCALLGDLVICAPVVEREAREQGKAPEAHWAHMVIHGLLHLRGHDHLDDAEADVMEGLEISLLAGLGYPNPYEEALPS